MICPKYFLNVLILWKMSLILVLICFQWVEFLSFFIFIEIMWILQILAWRSFFLGQVSTEGTVSPRPRSLHAQCLTAYLRSLDWDGNLWRLIETERGRKRELVFHFSSITKCGSWDGAHKTQLLLNPAERTATVFNIITQVHCVFFPQIFHSVKQVPKKL